MITDEENHCAAVQTRVMKVKEGKQQKLLKVTTIPGLDIGPEQLTEQQKTEQTLKKYWELAENPVENGKGQFFVQNEILYRKYIGKHDGEGIIQLVVPESLGEKVVSLAQDILLSGHRGSTKTLNRVLQEFYCQELITLCRGMCHRVICAKEMFQKVLLGRHHWVHYQ